MAEDVKNSENIQNEEKVKKGLSRRSFIKGMAATGVGLAAISSGLNNLAHADSWSSFTAHDLTEEQLIEMYDQMLRIRYYEETVAYRQSSVPGYRGYGHFSCGQEAVAVGASTALNPDDWMQGNHRSHHHAIAKGADIKGIAAEIQFKQDGTNSAHGGSMHLMDRNAFMLGEDGIVGPGAVLGAGAALGQKALGNNKVVLAYGGDAHFYTPYGYIAMHNSVKYNLPFVYVIERNGYAISNHWDDQTHVKSATHVAKAVGMHTAVVDGQSAINMYNVTKEAVDKARAGKGPTLIEAVTYRYFDHFGVGGAQTGGPNKGTPAAFGLPYRPDREVKHWLQKDPLDIHRGTLIKWDILSEEEADDHESKILTEIEEAFQFADDSPVPPAEDALVHVFVGERVPARQLPETSPL
ncbi:MAG: thiamine pyrophosphate-dependent enzyme [Bacillota bacterium]